MLPLHFLTIPTPTHTYTLSLHDALPISIQLHLPLSKAQARTRAIDMLGQVGIPRPEQRFDAYSFQLSGGMCQDRKSTRLNSSHVSISYAVFCLKKKNQHLHTNIIFLYVS